MVFFLNDIVRALCKIKVASKLKKTLKGTYRTKTNKYKKGQYVFSSTCCEQQPDQFSCSNSQKPRRKSLGMLFFLLEPARSLYNYQFLGKGPLDRTNNIVRNIRFTSMFRFPPLETISPKKLKPESYALVNCCDFLTYVAH